MSTQGDLMRRWLANKLEAWSYTLREWSDRVRPPYRRPPGVPETPIERITREQLAQHREAYARDLAAYKPDHWSDMFAKPHKLGETLKIRLPKR
jgi:hypothetical protein